jgi:putative endonuclease
MVHLLILSNRNDTVLHAVLCTNPAAFRAQAADAFSARYNLTKVVYHQSFPDAASAAARRDQINRWSRAKKDALIDASNPARRDLTVRPPHEHAY